MALTAPTTKQIAASSGFAYTTRAAQILKDFFDAVVTAIGSVPNWAAGVQDIAALKAVAAADRVDKQSRVVEDNGLGSESIYVFDSASTAGGDDVNVVVPTAGTGRWLLAYQGNAATFAVVNKTGVSLTKGRAVYPVGWDTTTGCLSVALADSSDPAKQAIGVLTATVLNNATGAASQGFKLAASGLDTSLSAVGVPVYYSNVGALTLTPPAAPAPQQIIARVRTLSASGVLAVQFEPVQPSSVVVGALASLNTIDQSSIVVAVNEVIADVAGASADAAAAQATADGARAYVQQGFAAGALGAGVDVSQSAMRCDAPQTVTAVHIALNGAPTVAPAANPDDVVIEVLKNGVTVVASKTYNNVAPYPAAFVYDALTLSVVPGAVDLAQGDSLGVVITQNGVAATGPGSNLAVCIALETNA